MTVISTKPKPLQKGDVIGVFAPSSYVEREDIEKSAAVVEKMGYKVFIHPQTYERFHQSAGNNLQKALAFQGLWQRPDISALWAAGGGNRAMHLLDTINFKKLRANPKHLIGFSDVTTLLNAVYAHTGIATVHGQVFKNLHRYNKIEQLFNILEGKPSSYQFNKTNVMRHGIAKGKLVGGNLSLFQYLANTLPNNFCHNAIIFLEDCDEELSKIDRMLLYLKQTGILSGASALIFGDFIKMSDTGRPFGFSLEDLIAEHTEGLNIPILINMPFGHGDKLTPFVIGSNAEIDTDKLTLTVV